AYVSGVNLDTRIITVGDGHTIRFGEESVISESGDVHTLAGVAEALELNKDVAVAGVGVRDTETEADLLAVEVKFIVKDPDRKEFEGEITGVNLENGTFTLNHEHIIKVTDRTTISETGDILELAGIAEALENDYGVVAFGVGEVDESSDASLIALEVKFVYQRLEFEGHVTGVNLDARTFTLDTGQVVRIGDDTVISDSGDKQSLEAVAESIDQQETIAAFGVAKPDSHSEADLIALEVKFKIDSSG
ncbi:MAG: hypothetical protein R3224_08620, partial [Balneolaceae bacterium]|nr:hypothetical protein [Balneolaceae bacterium]